VDLERMALAAMGGVVVSLIAFIASDWRARLARLEERVDHVRERANGLSKNYGPRIRALEGGKGPVDEDEDEDEDEKP
jgi:hypothetical protein